jgi:hypothetical protein
MINEVYLLSYSIYFFFVKVVMFVCFTFESSATCSVITVKAKYLDKNFDNALPVSRASVEQTGSSLLSMS